MRLHLVGPHMHGVQYGANSAESGHGAPAICQHALTPDWSHPGSPHLLLVLLTRPLLWCCLMKGLRGPLLAHSVNPTTSHSVMPAALSLFPHSALCWLLSKIQAQPAVSGSRRSSKISLNQPMVTAPGGWEAGGSVQGLSKLYETLFQEDRVEAEEITFYLLCKHEDLSSIPSPVIKVELRDVCV